MDEYIYKNHSWFYTAEKEFKTLCEENAATEEIEGWLKKYPFIPPLVKNLYRARYYVHIKEFNKGGHYLEKILRDIGEDITDPIELNALSYGLEIKMRLYFLAGVVYSNINQNDKALKYFQLFNLVSSRTGSFNASGGLLSFRSFNDYSLKDLINKEITVCSPYVMNDPYDTLLMKWGEFKRIDLATNKCIPIQCAAFESYRIRSFCKLKGEENNDMVSNMLMWSHYADNHYGFCVKYIFSNNFIKTENRYTSRFREICYHKHNEPLSITENSINIIKGFLTKLDSWSYENEVRLITYYPDYSGPFMPIELDKESRIESIYFGYRCPDDRIKTIKNILGNINYYKMVSNYNDIYSLRAVQI